MCIYSAGRKERNPGPCPWDWPYPAGEFQPHTWVELARSTQLISRRGEVFQLFVPESLHWERLGAASQSHDMPRWLRRMRAFVIEEKAITAELNSSLALAWDNSASVPGDWTL